jgi:D-3-phosphoglycerate dehydrogenase
MQVVVWTMHPERYPDVAFIALDKLYGTSDVVSLHLRLSAETRGFVDARALAGMKRGAILINTARGAIIDEPALLDALRHGPLACAGLDVFTREPLPAGDPLTALPNVVLTPHCAGITPEALHAGLRMAVDNIWKFLA